MAGMVCAGLEERGRLAPKHNTLLMDICCGSLTPKCQHGYRLPPNPPPLPPPFFQCWKWTNAGSLLHSPCSATCACIFHGLAATCMLWKWCQENRNAVAGWDSMVITFWNTWKNNCDPEAMRYSLSVLDFNVGAVPKTQENFGGVKLWEPVARILEEICTNTHASQTSFCLARW